MKRRPIPNWFQALLFRMSVMVHLFAVPRWAISSVYFAVIIGYNELAKQQTDLGKKAICRLMLRITENAAQSVGIAQKVPFFGNRIVLEVSMEDGIPSLQFRESDIELMRAAVEKFDSDRSKR